ncbi:MAG TPA: isocitrate/isopropylmalate dehydrogenase family protein, partial [Candidatus Handelsmanbacteria bacterium]|nr:isocitrate/isopropylmalate dehydrogenase family protein [Candidatus Handelsmanbacteria bacterium]
MGSIDGTRPSLVVSAGMSTYDIAVLPGDGIAPEVVAEAQRVLDAAAGPVLNYREHPCGANCYLETGDPLPPATVEACRDTDAVLLGAMGLPDVRWPDGTEMRPQVDLRFLLDLYAGVRPIYLYAEHHSPLKGYGAGDIDFIILRENVEGLFASMNGGIQVRDETAVDSMVITRSGTERISEYAFKLAADRQAERAANQRGARETHVTCVDKANVFKSMAFFRHVFDGVAAGTDIHADHAYVDAMSLHLVRRPESYDVMVTENMYGDILSDLGAGLVEDDVVPALEPRVEERRGVGTVLGVERGE